MARLLLVLLGLLVLGSSACDGGAKTTVEAGGLTLNLDLASSGADLADTFQVTGFDGAGTVVYGPVSVPRASQVMLADVPTRVARVQVTFLLGPTVLGTLGAPVNLSPGSATVDLTRVAATPVARLSALDVAPATAQIAVGGLQDFRARGRFDDGASYDVTAAVTWSSANPSVAIIDRAGRASGVATGAAYVTATSSGVTSAPATLTVTAAPGPSVELPTISAITPARGAYGGGTTIVIAGQHLTGATAVRIGASAAASFKVDSDAQITAVTPPGAGEVQVTVRTPTGTSAGHAYTFVAAPVVSKVRPGNGPQTGGNPVILTGSNLADTTDVSFGPASASFVIDSPTQITATAPAGTGVVPVTLTTLSGTSAPFDYAYLPIPALTALAPQEGPSAGGTSVRLTGTGLEGATQVDFGETPATSFEVLSDAEIRAVAPEGTGISSVRVTTPAGQSNGVDYAFRPLPTIASAQPTRGPEAGGNSVTLTGTGFTGASAVRFGSATSANVTVTSDTQITAVAPAGTGSGSITVVTPGGTSAASSYQYVPTPALTSVAPTMGPEAGGTVVTLSGARLAGATDVRFGSAPAQSFTLLSDGEISATAPAGTGTVQVTAVTPGGTSTGASFQYAPVPTLTALAPASGPEPGGHATVLTGTGFLGVTAVKFGATSATGLTVQSPTQLTVNVPAGTGAQPVTVIAAGGTSASQSYSYVPGPVIVSMQPARGPLGGGAVVTLLGGPFGSASAVKFGGAAASAFTVVSSSEIRATAPAGTGTQSVTVVTTGGTSNGSPFSYVQRPDVTALAPTVGPLIGGNWVTVTGTDLTDATQVHFGTIPATDFTLVSATEIHAQAPPGTRTVDLTVTTAGGVSEPFPYAYGASATLSTVLPASGPVAGGQTVVLTGIGFTGATAVSFGAAPAASFVVDSNTQVTAVTPAGTGAQNVSVTTPLGQSSTVAYQFVGAPTIASVSPNIGAVAGGNSATLTGTNLTGATAVSVGGSAASFVVVSSTSITLTTPPGSPGSAAVSVTTPGGTASAPGAFSYAPVPAITLLNPAGGPLAGGNTIALTGTGFTLATQVLFDGTPGTSLAITSDTAATVVAPAGVGAVSVTLVAPGGTSAGSPYVFVAGPAITNVSPANIPSGGATITLTGTGFGSADTITLDGVPMAFTSLADTTAMVTAPAHAGGTVPVVVSGPGGTSNIASLTYVDAPVASSLAPASGPIAGGNTVTLTGTNLSTTSGVTFDGVAGTMLMATSDTSVLVLAPAHAAGNVPVSVTTPGGSTGVTGGYTYADAPTLSGLSPSAGPLAGGTSVTLTGTGFTMGDTSVSFDAIVLGGASVTVNNATSLTVTAPAGSAGPVAVVVTTSGGSSAPQSFDYVSAPSISAIAPTTGSTAGGTALTITGAGFVNGGTQATLGNTPLSVTVVDATTLTATAPAHAAGTVDLTVTTVGGTATASGAYTYAVPAPGLTFATPSMGSNLGGTGVVLAGSAFTGATAVTFDGVAATSFVVDSDTQITATSPVHHTPGAVDVVVTTPAGAGTLTGGYTYSAAAVLLPTASPTGGGVAGGTSVVLTGSGFTGATAVSFGGVVATSFTVDSDTQITATTPAHAAGATNVDVTAPGGVATLTNGFTFYTGPALTSISPNSGPAAGGTSVTLTGSGFTGTTSVTFDGTPGTSLTVVSDTQITVTSPAHAVGAVNVVVTNPGGSATAGGGYTYLAPTALSSAYPPAGPTAGGTSVVLTGSGFLGTTGASAVTFGGADAAGYTVDSDTQITALSPAHAMGGVMIAVTSPLGSASTSFTYTDVPILLSVSPLMAARAGGVPITITGLNLGAVSDVTFDVAGFFFTHVASSSFASRTATQIVINSVMSPISGPSPAAIKATNLDGTSAPYTGFSFQ